MRVLSIIPKEYNIDWNFVLLVLLLNGYQSDFMNVLLLIPNSYPIDWDTLKQVAMKEGNNAVISYINSKIQT